LTAADLVLGGERAAYGLCRPPGHHAARSMAGGYCFFNNAAIAANHVASTTGSKVTVLDVDYHHGNGTQEIFYGRDDVQYVSLHGDPARAYPYIIGYADETGTGRGAGCNINIPLAARTDDDHYVEALERACESILAFGPAMIIVSLGLDTFVTDPISDLSLTADGFQRCGAVVAAMGLPTVALQEGGYDVGALGDNVRRWLIGLGAVGAIAQTADAVTRHYWPVAALACLVSARSRASAASAVPSSARHRRRSTSSAPSASCSTPATGAARSRPPRTPRSCTGSTASASMSSSSPT